MPLCNARLFEDGLSFHITITYRRNIFLNSVHVSVATIGPRSRRVCVFQTFLSLLLFSMIFLFRNFFSLKKRYSILYHFIQISSDIVILCVWSSYNLEVISGRETARTKQLRRTLTGGWSAGRPWSSGTWKGRSAPGTQGCRSRGAWEDEAVV